MFHEAVGKRQTDLKKNFIRFQSFDLCSVNLATGVKNYNFSFTCKMNIEVMKKQNRVVKSHVITIRRGFP